MACHDFSWTRTCILAFALTFGLTACQSGPGDAANESGRAVDAERRPDGGEAAADRATGAASKGEAVALPPVPRADQFRPLTGDALTRARKPLEQILADLTKPDYLEAVSTQPNGGQPDDVDDAEPPLAAQRAYVAGRIAWHEENTYQAISELESALRLAPDRPEILRLLGRIYTEAGNKVRGAMNYKKAVRVDPTHIASVFLLGRFAMEQGDYDEAIIVLHHALEQLRQRSDADRALEPLLHYYLAGALRERGYAAAAIEQHAQYRATVRGRGSLSRIGRELAVITDQARFTWIAIGDMHHQLNQPAKALEAYRHAREDEQAESANENEQGDANPPAELVARLIYTHLCLGDPEPAHDVVIDYVRRTEGRDASLALVRYLAEQSTSSEAMAAQLRRVYIERGRSAGLAIAVADLLPVEQGDTLLREHLTERPADHHVFQALLERLLPADADDSERAQLAEAIVVVAMSMAESPEHAEQRAGALFEAVRDGRTLLEGFNALDASQQARPMVQLLHGLALMRAGFTDRAAAPLEQAMQAAPEMDATRLALARLAIHEQDYEHARTLLEPLADRNDPRVVRLRVQVLAETGELEQALALLNQRVEQGGTSVELILQKAQLQIRANEPASAERTLLDALNMYPTDERLYQALLNMYDPGDNQQPLINDATRQWQRLVRRLLDTIPDSRTGRLVRAELYEARGQVNEALGLLEDLLQQQPMDLEVIQRMVRLYEASDQRRKAAALLEEKIEAHPEHFGLLTLALQFYHAVENRQRAVEMIDQILALDSPNAQHLQSIVIFAVRLGVPAKATEAIEQALSADEVEHPTRLVSLLRLAMHRAGEGEQAVERLRELADRFPEHEADVYNHLSLLLQQLGRSDKAEQVLLDTLEKHPDHAPTNNALGYEWARQGKNLERARAMIEKALEVEPNSAAYLDSLGWVYYKLGEFEEAVKWLQRSRAAGGDDAVIVDHLGDALYRAGQTEEARRAWARAASQHGQTPFPEEYPELEGLRERAYKKIQAVRDGGVPPVATVPEDEAADDAADEQAEVKP